MAPIQPTLNITHSLLCRQLKWSDCDHTAVHKILQGIEPPNIEQFVDTDAVLQQVDVTMSDCISRSRIESSVMEPNPQENRFRKLFETNDSKNIWKAINWSGSLASFKDTNQRPSDEEFKDYFQSLLNPSDAEPLILPPGNCPYVPVTDDPFTPEEIQNAIKQIKPDKSGGPSGVPPGCLKSLPVKWIMFLALIFSNVFVTCTIPAKWSLSRLIVLFKKGKSSVC